MVIRKIHRNRYFLAFFITLIVFMLGLLLGLVIEDRRVQLIKYQNDMQKLDFSSLQLQYQFIDMFGEEKNCGALTTAFEESISNLENSRNKLEGYTQNSNLNRKEFDLLKREYTLAQLNFWMLTKKTKNLCGLEPATIFYFYADSKSCSRCDDQAFVLTYLKNKLGANLLNFVFDSQLEEPMITILKKNYNLTEYPTLIINDKKFSGFVSKEEILQEICPSYRQTRIELCSEKQTVVIG